MRERDDHAAAQLRARGVTLAVVLPRMPVGQVLAPVRMDGQHLAERPRLDQLARLVDGGMITELEPNQDAAPALRGGLLQEVESRQRVGDRLFEQDMTSRLGGWDGHLQMQRRGIGHHDRLGLVLLQRLSQVRFDGIACQLVIGQGRLAGAEQDDIRLTQGDQVTKVTSANGAETSNQEFHTHLPFY